MSVTRYTWDDDGGEIGCHPDLACVTDGMVIRPENGTVFVPASDYDALAARCAEMEARCEEMRNWIDVAIDYSQAFEHDGVPVLVTLAPMDYEFYEDGERLSAQPDADGEKP